MTAGDFLLGIVSGVLASALWEYRCVLHGHAKRLLADFAAARSRARIPRRPLALGMGRDSVGASRVRRLERAHAHERRKRAAAVLRRLAHHTFVAALCILTIAVSLLLSQAAAEWQKTESAKQFYRGMFLYVLVPGLLGIIAIEIRDRLRRRW